MRVAGHLDLLYPSLVGYSSSHIVWYDLRLLSYSQIAVEGVV